MAITNYYVDPSINANSGTGTIGDPFGDLQYALDTVTRDSTNGDQFNIKSGTAEVLTGSLSLSSYGTPTAGAHLILSGYTSAANDEGIGIIDGDGLYQIISAPDYCSLKDLELKNTGSSSIVTGSTNYSFLVNCTMHNCSGSTYGVQGFVIARCHFYDIGSTYAVYSNDCFGSAVFQSASNPFSYAMTTFRGRLLNNIIHITDTANGIKGHNQILVKCVGNSILSNGGVGIEFSGSSYGTLIADNLIEGCSYGIRYNTQGITAGNASYGSTVSDYDIGNGFNNESLSASPFEKTGAATWANAKDYFAPASVGNVRTAAYTSIDGVKGAIAFSSQSVVSPQLHPLG